MKLSFCLLFFLFIQLVNINHGHTSSNSDRYINHCTVKQLTRQDSLFSTLVSSETLRELYKKNNEEKELITFKGRTKTGNRDFLFEVHTPKTHYEMGQRVVEILEQESRRLFKYFRYVPRPTVHFLIKTDRIANGAATVFPTNLVYLNDFPPLSQGQLSSNKNWMKALLIHELTHIIHMDQTRGLLKGMRSIFGSAGKLGGVAPRWFSEGIATWAESTFTPEGRLNSPKVSHSHARLFFERDACSRIDCLDEPKNYPFGSHPYWAGSHFLKWLEDKKSGTIRCLVKANSDSIAFFLNSSFKECTGKSAKSNFRRYRRSFKRKLIRRGKETRKLAIFKPFKKLKTRKGEKISWFNNMGIKGEHLVYVGISDKIPSLVSLNLNSGDYKKANLKGYVEYINSFNQSSKAVSVMRTQHWDKSHSKELVYYFPESNKVKTTGFKNGDYYFTLSNGKKLVARYLRSQWQFFVMKKNNPIKSDSKPRFKLPKLVPFHSPISLRIGKKPYIGFMTNYSDDLKSYDGTGKYYYYILSLDGKFTLRKIISSKDPMVFNGSCGSRILVKKQNNKGFFLANAADAFNSQKVPVSIYNGVQINEIQDIVMGKDFTLVKSFAQKMSPLIYKGNCQNFLTHLSKNSKGNVLLTPSKDDSFIESVALENEKLTKSNLKRELKQRDKEISKNWQSYPSLRHFRPYYWYFWPTLGTNFDSISASTSLQDPFDKHILSLSGNYYFENDEFSPVTSYSYSRGLYRYSASYAEFYSESSISPVPDRKEFSSIGISRPWGFGNKSLSSSLLAQKGRTKDFLSSKRYYRFNADNTLTYLPRFRNDFWQTSVFRLKAFQQLTQDREDFFGVQTKVAVSNYLNKKWQSYANLSYGKLLKKDLTSGALFGGGTSSGIFGIDVFHEFYGLPYSDAFGNDILTARGQFEWLIKESHKGSGVTPFFLKNYSLIFGGDYLKAQRVFLDEKLFRDKDITSIHVGLRADVTLFFLVKLEVDFLIANILDSDAGDSDTSSLLLLKGQLF